MTGTILGRGAFTDVHLAINLKTGQQVACKIHRIDQFRQSLWSTSIIRRIVDETNILSRLTHVSGAKSYEVLSCLIFF